MSSYRNSHNQRTYNGTVGLTVPVETIRQRCRPYLHNNKPTHLPIRTHDTDFSIISQYQQEYRGLVEYYRLAYNLHQFGRLKWAMGQSLAKTLATKYRVSVSKVFTRYRATLHTPDGPRIGLQVIVDRGEHKRPLVAQWGGISLRRNVEANLEDHPPQIWSTARSELLQRLLADTCELCGSHENVEVHHIRKLADIKRRGGHKPEWMRVMIARHRKTLMVCQSCHHSIHAGQWDGRRVTEEATSESRIR